MIIGIVGKARSGKDTFGKMLAEELFKKFKRTYVMMAYAQELKLRVQADFDLSYDQLWGNEKEILDTRYSKIETVYEDSLEVGDYPKSSQAGTMIKQKDSFWTPREILQAYGEFYRSIDYDFWVKALFQKVDEKGYKDIIISDVRHPNEADPIVDRDGYIIKIKRNEAPKIHGPKHISETAMDDYANIDYTVINDYGLKELKFAAGEVADFISEKENGRSKNG